jgi:hypothetical protein
MRIKKKKGRTGEVVSPELAEKVFEMADGVKEDGGGKVVLWVHPNGGIIIIPYVYAGEPWEFAELWKLAEGEAST